MIIHSNTRYSRFGLTALLVFGLLICRTSEAQHSELALLDSIQRIMDKKHIPGMFISVMNSDSVIWNKGIGFADLRSKTPVAQQLFQIGSVTKSFAALAVMKLVSEGKLSLFDTLAILAPEIPFSNPWEKTNPVLLHHLLEHKAGFDDMHFAAFAKAENVRMEALEEVNKHKNSLESRWPPGLVHSYSNPSYAIIGYLIEKYSGRPYQEYIREEVLIPLKMNHTYFMSELSGKQPYPLAQGYSWYDNQFNEAATLYIVGEAAGALLSNANDMTRFVQFYLNEGVVDSAQVMSHDTFKELETIHSEFERRNSMQLGYTLGLFPRHYGIKSKFLFRGHSGGILGFGSDFIYNRELNLGIVVSNNGETGNRQVVDLLVDYFAKEQEANYSDALPLSDGFEKWEGNYLMMNSRNKIFRFIDVLLANISIERKGDTLLLTPFMDDAQIYQLNIDGGYKKVDESTSSLFLVEMDGQRVVQFLGDHYKPFNKAFHYLLLTIIVTSCLAGVSALVVLMIRIGKLLVKRRSKELTVVIISAAIPYMIFCILFYAFFSMIPLHKIMRLGEFNFNTSLIYLLSILHPFATLFSIFILVRNWQYFSVSKIRYLYSVINMGAVALSFYLITNGWFAIAFWKY